MENKSKERIRVNAFHLNQILKDRKIPSGAKLVLLSLIYRLGGKTFAFPSQRRIAEDIGLTERQIRNHLKVLREKGVISWSRGVVNPRTKKLAKVNKYDLSNILQRK